MGMFSAYQGPLSWDQHEQAQSLVPATPVPPQFDRLIFSSVVGSDHVKKPVVVEVGNPDIVGTLSGENFLLP
jgi:hypothetical protein